jgi:predicted metalloprotease with PDZ domain
MEFRPLAASLLAVLLGVTAAPALPQAGVPSAPQAVPIVATAPAPLDVPFPGTLSLEVDATDVTRGVYRATETIPVPPGQREMILLLPNWIPGKHAPRGFAHQLADLHFAVDGKPVAWRRDPVDVYAFHVPVPEGARTLTATFVHTSPLQTSEGRITMTREMLNLQWEAMSLYPAGHYVRQIRIAPAATFPEGWQVFTALDGKRQQGNRVSWDATRYDTLIDSPVYAGKYARVFDLGHQVKIDAVADKPELLELTPEHLATYRKLVAETLALFGARHFDHYDFLLAQTNRLGDIGVEHHRSSENAQEPTSLTEWDKMAWDRNTLPHEFVHSWNGKYRRPAALWTPDYRTPMQDSLLWLYEGQDQFWGWVLSARSGVQPKDIVLGAIANSAGSFSMLPGRAWRSVEDTTNDPIVAARRPLPYPSLSRSEDYYWEGLMVWLEADQIIREGTRGARGLDDFARAFFGVNDGDWGELTYQFDDIVTALNAVYPHDWAGFLRSQFETAGAPPPLAGIEKAGYRLVWRDQPNPYTLGVMTNGSYLNLLYSLGVNVDSAGKVTQTFWDGPAFDAGLVTGAQIVAVNGTEFSADAIKNAITAAKDSRQPIELLVKRGDRFLTVPVDYHGGLRYPWLEPKTKGEQPLDRLLAPRTR